MTNHKRAGVNRDAERLLQPPERQMVQLATDLWAEIIKWEGTDDVENGRTVSAEFYWTADGFPSVRKLTIEVQPPDEINTSMVRSISIPALLATAQSAVKFWTDEARTEAVDEARRPGETLELWAARLYRMAVATYRSATDVIAEAQGITSMSASQRLVTIRKMGLVPSSTRRRP